MSHFGNRFEVQNDDDATGDDQDSDDSGNDDFPESIGDIEQWLMVPLGPLNPPGVLLRSGQLNEFNTQEEDRMRFTRNNPKNTSMVALVDSRNIYGIFRPQLIMGY